jgi:thiol-disulfide isomerase/thioredoxin
MKRSFRSRIWESLWLVGALLLVYVVISSRGSVRLVPEERAEVAPALTVRSVAQLDLSLAERRGKVVLINLWASWCGPCRREIPRLNRLAAEFDGGEFELWGLNAESLEGGELQKVAAELGIEYDVYRPAAPLIGVFQGEGVIPHSWLIDREGRVRASHAGLPSERSLRRVTQELLNER